jgi:hypothetical protein
MTLLTAETDVFGAAAGQRCGVVFLARRRALPGPARAAAAAGVRRALAELADQGWQLSVGEMFGDRAQPSGYDTGFAHDVDVAGVFDAPSLADALAGTVALAAAGWDRLLRTEWLVGPREFGTVVSPNGRAPRNEWGFLALWEWNDAWQAASDDERREYDRECDVAFSADLAAGVSIAGRHRLDWASRWHHLGVWEVPDPQVVADAMHEHERVADFKFTTSRHYIGRVRALAELLEENADD